ncbi:type IV secretion system protein [Sphingorhabdus sp.]|uniref:type IV secretion system protein n=1 Tax=Sphingorhabdus sp. TaxID=1902408 RepID=UPI0039830C6E
MNPGFCAAPEGPGLAARLLADTDCQSFGLVERGYAALSQPGGPVAATLTGLLVLAVAFFGYRLILGRGLLLVDAVSLALKIGVVLLLATSWEAWQAVAYDTFARAPVRVAGEMLTGLNAIDPIAGLQAALDGLQDASVGYRTRAGIASPLVGGPAAAAMTLNLSSYFLTLSILGLLVVARILLALLLAITPVMAGFILFDATRGMASRWLAAMAAAAFVPMFVLVLAAVELSILNPMITRLLAEQAAERFENEAVTPIGLVAVIFALSMMAAVWAGTKIASGIRLPGAAKTAPTQEPILKESIMSPPILAEQQSSAVHIAQMLERAARREAGPTPAMAGAASFMQISNATSNGSRARRDASAQSEGIFAAPSSRRAALPRAQRRTRTTARRDA